MIVGQSGHVERRIDFVCLSPHACGSGLVFFEHACFFTVECGPLDLASWKCRAAAARCAARVWGRWRSFLLYYALSISFFRFLRDLAGLRRAGWSVRAGGGALEDADGVWLVSLCTLYPLDILLVHFLCGNKLHGFTPYRSRLQHGFHLL